MIIGTCKVYLSIHDAYSLKDKRSILKGTIEKMKNKFNISVSEIDYQDVIQSAAIGFACVTTESKHANSIIQNTINYIEKICEAEIIDIEIEIL